MTDGNLPNIRIPHFEASIAVATGETNEDGKPVYRRTQLGVAFEDTRHGKRHITIYSDLWLHPIHLWQIVPKEKETTEAAQEGDVDLNEPPF